MSLLSFIKRVFGQEKQAVKTPSRVKAHFRHPHNKIHFTDDQIELMRNMRNAGASFRQIADIMGCSHVTVMRRLEAK